MKFKRLLICLFSLIGIFVKSQTNQYSPNRIFENVYDRFGNQYSLDDIKIVEYTNSTLPITQAPICDSGIFNLHFGAGSGFMPSDPDYLERRNVICQVFSDISNFINSPLETTGEKVEIWVTGISNNNALGSASSFYVIPAYSPISYNISGGVLDNEVWKTINSGKDSYTNVVSPLNSMPSGFTNNFYHGMVAINFSNINWNLDLNIDSPSNEYDLYTVILHEVTHALGFASLIKYDGSSVFGPNKQYFSRYDTFLKDSDNGFLISNGECNFLYDNDFISDEFYLHPNCSLPDGINSGTSLDSTICNNAVKYIGPTQEIEVYTPNCFELGSSLSHFEDMCYINTYGFPNGNNNYFSMCNAIGQGVTKRFLKHEERQVLCDIGYSVNTEFGISPNYYNYSNTAICNGFKVVGINDGIDNIGMYSFTGDATTINPIVIPIHGTNGIVSNDFNGITNNNNDIIIECLQDVYDSSAQINGSNTPYTSLITDTSVNFVSSIPGLHLLRYVPIVNGVRGNITYVYVYIYSSNCEVETCSIIKNGDFENSSCGQLNGEPDQSPGLLECWEALSGTPDIYTVNCNYPSSSGFNIPGNNFGSSVYNHAPLPHNSPNNSFIGFAGEGESYQTALSTPLQTNNTYVISFWARIPDSTNVSTPFDLYIASVDDIMPPIPGGVNENNLTHFEIFNTIVPSDNQWHFYNETFTFDEATNDNAIILLRRNDAINQFTYIYIDDLSITPVNPSVVFEMPDNICENQILLSLDNYLSNVISGGIFSGDNVTYDSISDTYSLTSTNQGIYTINYTYIENNSGCPVTVTLSDTFEILDCNTATTPIIPNISSFCLNEDITSNPLLGSYLNENNMSIIGTWNPSSIDTSTAGTFDYVFTPNLGQNAFSVTTTITITNPITPIFDIIQPICKDFVAPSLLPISNNNITGTWYPSIIDTSELGIFTYTFTPDDGECASVKTLQIEIIDCNPYLNWITDVSCEQTDEVKDPKLPGDDNINDGPCIKVCKNSTINYSLTGDSSVIQDTQWNITGGSVTYEDNVNCEISWNGSSFAFIEAIVTFINGETITIHRCVEKLETPTALFSINHNSNNICSNTPVSFDNSSIAGSGNGEIYYNWSFGDGHTSTEFEPTHTYTNAGTYIVTLHVYNGCSCEDIFEMEIVIGEGLEKIECNGVICEGQIGNYTIDSSCTVHFEVEGNSGEIIDDSNNQLTILWNNVDASGFATISASCDDGCTSSIKIPVIQNEGKINGSSSICENQQQIYRLPQWPTTDFNWTLDDGGTGATLILNNQRNEIIVQSNTPGNLTLYCNYQNTLLGCGGVSQLSIEVLPDITLSPITPVCINTNSVYQFIAEGLPITQPISYIIEGPNSYSLTGSGTSVSFTPALPGIYNVITSSSNYCTNKPLIIRVLDIPAAPTQIIGETIVCPTTPYIYSVPNITNAIANWSVNGGTILGSNTGNSVLIQFDSSATPPYEVSVFYSRLGCDGIPAILEVNPDTPVVSFIQAPTPVCASSIANYEITSNTDLDFINWSILPSNAGSIINGQNTSEIQVNWNNIGAGAIVRATVRKCGIEHVFDTSVIVNLAPIIEIVADTEACAGNGNPVSFSVNGIFSGIVTWDFGDGTTEVGQNVIHHFSEPLTTSTQYNVSVTVQDPNDCTNSATANHLITISPSPIINLDHAPFLNVCYNNNQPGDYDFSIVLQGGWAQTNVQSIVWTHNGVAIANNTPTLVIDENNPVLGNYQATVTNSFGCSATTPIIRVVSDCPTQGVCNITETLSTNLTTTCNSASIVATPTGTPDIVVFKLSNGLTLIDSTAPYEAIFDNLQPGEYIIEVDAVDEPFVDTCWTSTSETFIIPYEPDFKFEVSCNGNGNYDITLLDHSRYYDPTGLNNPIDDYEFTINGGIDWFPGNEIGGIQQLTFFNVPPGTTPLLGIRISGLDPDDNPYPVCQKIEPEPLDFPIATFTQSHTEICEGEPVTFTPDIINPDWTYNWIFGDGSENSNPITQKTFTYNPVSSEIDVFLVVSNKFGCQTLSSSSVEIIEEKINGELVADNNMVCLGTPVTLSFNSVPTTQITDPEQPTSLIWFMENQNNPINVSPPALSLTVTEPGYYFAYGTNQFGCITTTNIAEVVVRMIPAPMYTIEGPEVLCFGNDIILNTINTPNTNYYWSVNGTELPNFNGLSTINYSPTSTGNYVFELVTETLDGQGNPCKSLPSIHEVTILESPQIPIIDIIGVQCLPYQVTATVTNPQPGVVYYWSNGNIGTTAVITHDGPLQVRAEALGCSETSQIDLPLDLKQHEWLFPKGCFEYCKFENFNGYIIGPLGEIKWTWFHDAQTDSTGNGLVDPISVTEGVYDFVIANTWCDLEIGTATVKANECINCDISIEPLDIYCDTVFGTNVYAISLQISNNMNGLSLSLTAPNGEGYFSPSTFQVPVSSNTIYNGYFIPNSSFSGGSILINIEGTDGIEVICSRLYELNLHCEGTPRMAEPKDKIILSPNPTKNKAEVLYELTESGLVQLLVTDISGRELFIFENKKTSGKFEIDLSLLPEGYYPVTLIQNGTIVYSSKLIKN